MPIKKIQKEGRSFFREPLLMAIPFLKKGSIVFSDAVIGYILRFIKESSPNFNSNIYRV